jgi:rare lipoprotein A
MSKINHLAFPRFTFCAQPNGRQIALPPVEPLNQNVSRETDMSFCKQLIITMLFQGLLCSASARANVPNKDVLSITADVAEAPFENMLFAEELPADGSIANTNFDESGWDGKVETFDADSLRPIYAQNGPAAGSTRRVAKCGLLHSQVGTASWYGPGFQGRRTANGERFDTRQLTAASRTLELGTRVRVFNRLTGLAVIVRINDRGPYADTSHRIIDLSRAAATAIGMDGMASVQLDCG